MQPDWFRNYLAQAPEHREVVVKGAKIHYQHWHNPGRQGLLFVHGHAAHAHWWDFIAPAFKEHYDIVALDLSGSGDSDHRDNYSARGFSDELIAVMRDANLVNPIVVGHSFGGAMTRVSAWLNPDTYHGIVLVDSAIPRHIGSRKPPPMPRQKERFYPSLEQGMRRFRLRPPQPCENGYVLEHIASHSLRATDKGFQFKLDSAVFAKMQHAEDFPAAATMIQALEIPVGMIYGAESRFFPEPVVQDLQQLIDPSAICRVDDAHHHVFLDQPQRFIETLESLLATFSE